MPLATVGPLRHDHELVLRLQHRLEVLRLGIERIDAVHLAQRGDVLARCHAEVRARAPLLGAEPGEHVLVDARLVRLVERAEIIGLEAVEHHVVLRLGGSAAAKLPFGGNARIGGGNQERLVVQKGVGGKSGGKWREMDSAARQHDGQRLRLISLSRTHLFGVHAEEFHQIAFGESLVEQLPHVPPQVVARQLLAARCPKHDSFGSRLLFVGCDRRVLLLACRGSVVCVDSLV